jgi:hypothetical protein
VVTAVDDEIPDVIGRVVGRRRAWGTVDLTIRDEAGSRGSVRAGPDLSSDRYARSRVDY